MEYRSLNKRQKQRHWQEFHETQAIKTAQLQQLTALRGPVSTTCRHVHGQWSMNELQTMLTPPPIVSAFRQGLLESQPPKPPAPPELHAPLAPPIAPPTLAPPPTPPAMQFTWMSESDWQHVPTLREVGLHTTGWSGEDGCFRKRHTHERAAAAGFEANGWRPKAVRKAERRCDPEVARRQKEADARRQRVLRIEERKEDRDALRKLARSRDDGTMLELEPTPEGLRMTATDGTPRSARAAGAKLRDLTQTFYQRLMDPRFYNVSHEQLEEVQADMEFYDATANEWTTSTRPLKLFGGKKKRYAPRVW
jgi:hypothetical protein